MDKMRLKFYFTCLVSVMILFSILVYYAYPNPYYTDYSLVDWFFVVLPTEYAILATASIVVILLGLVIGLAFL